MQTQTLKLLFELRQALLKKHDYESIKFVDAMAKLINPINNNIGA